MDSRITAKFGCGRIIVHFDAAGTAELVLGSGDKEADFITQYANTSTDGHLARSVRELLNRGIAVGFGSLSVFESLLWEEALGFPTAKLNALANAQWLGLPKGSISAVSFDEKEKPVENSHAEFDHARDKVLLIALVEAHKQGADISTALAFLIMFGYARWVEES